jgi:hypothetical protein
MGRDERKKAGDVFRESAYLFGEKTSFAEAHPEIEDISVEVEEHGKGVDSSNRTRTHTKSNLPGEFVSCHNPMCYGGGFQLGLYLFSMTSSKKTEFEETTLCVGNEGSPKGGRIYRRCVNTFKIKIHIIYKGAKKHDTQTAEAD